MRLTCLDLSTRVGALAAWQARPDERHHFVNARTVPELLAQLDHAQTRYDVVDIFSHGFGGGMTFGGETLLSADGFGYQRLPSLGRVVAPGGHLRLLGCATATDSWWRGGQVHLRGSELLAAVALALDGGRAWGTTDRLSIVDLSPTGIDDARVRPRLVPSGRGAPKAEREVAVARSV